MEKIIMDYETKKQIAIIGRGVSNPKWNILYEILDDNSEDIAYLKYDAASAKWESQFKQHPSFDAYIYLSTMPKYNDKPYVKLPASCNNDDIIEALEELSGKIFKEEDENTDIPSATDIIDDSNDNNEHEELKSNEEVICNDTIDAYDSNSNNVLSCNDGNVCINDNSSDSRKHFEPNELSGIQIEINKKKIILNVEDIDRLNKLMEFAIKFDFSVTDIIYNEA